MGLGTGIAKLFGKAPKAAKYADEAIFGATRAGDDVGHLANRLDNDLGDLTRKADLANLDAVTRAIRKVDPNTPGKIVGRSAARAGGVAAVGGGLAVGSSLLGKAVADNVRNMGDAFADFFGFIVDPFVPGDQNPNRDKSQDGGAEAVGSTLLTLGVLAVAAVTIFGRKTSSSSPAPSRRRRKR
ncbi:MAG: hypothetical protein KY455_10140 [Euryarchaeota archaeon]|nr:hypothetical protein [Euryarchaeota archaeon]